MKILVVSQYFWPEEFRINDLCIELSKLGHEVTVLTGIPNYPSGKLDPSFKNDPKQFSSLNGIKIIRVPIFLRGNSSIKLALNYISYFLSASFIGTVRLAKCNFDVVFVCQLSPILVALPAILFKKIKGIPIAMWSLDLWPDSVRAVGKGDSDWIYKSLTFIVRFIYKRCDLILGQSAQYLHCVSELDGGNSKKVIFPNWAEELFSIERPKRKKNDRFRILFAGNIGEAQDFESIVACASILKDRKIDVVFSIVGDGSKFDWLNDSIHNLGLQLYFDLHGRHPVTKMPSFYEDADAALLSLKANKIFSVTVPGKLQTYMMARLPVLGMIDGAGYSLIMDSGCGLSCGASDVLGLVKNIVQMVGMSESDLEIMGENGYTYALGHFSREDLVKRLCHELEELI